MPAPLLLTRRFLPLFLTQGLGALNDNLFKNALVVLIVFRNIDGGAVLIALAGGVFILPYLLFSATAGQLADRFDKARLIRINKAAEIALMLAGGAGLLTGSIPLLLAVLFGLGAQAAFFGPLKYGILPERLGPDELLRGNALVEAGTFAAILLGTIAGGALIGVPAGPAVVAICGLVVAVAGLASALAIAPGPAAAPDLPLGWNVAAETLALLRLARRDRQIWVGVLGLSWFWALGATFLAQFPVLAQAEFHADNRVVTLLLAGFAVGVGLGSLLVGRFVRGRDAVHVVPLAALLLSAFTWGFAALATLPGAAGWITPGAMLASPAGLAATLCLLGAAACGGVYSVPLYATLQQRAEPAERARIVAANNVMNALFMVLGAAVIAGMAAAGLRPGGILAIAGGLNAVAAFLLRRGLRAPVARGTRLRHEGA